MARDFRELSDRLKAEMSVDARRVYDAAAISFEAEFAARAELGTRLAEAREARALTQQALTALSGIQQPEISRIERGLGNPTATTLIRLTAALGQRITLAPTG
jgi:predicted XRE-type DNA-binding protein